MRVIAGSSRGRRLATFSGREIRPTPDRVREALFSILQSKLGTFADLTVLDLYAGSGALAIEALSRGAASACLVEIAPASQKIVRENLVNCRFADRAELISGDAGRILPQLGGRQFDLIFLDPPYGQELARQAIIAIAELDLLSADGILCAETGAEEDLPETCGKMLRIDQRRYGTTMLHFYSWS